MTMRRVLGFLAAAVGSITLLWVIALAIVAEPEAESPAANLDQTLDTYLGPDIAMQGKIRPRE